MIWSTIKPIVKQILPASIRLWLRRLRPRIIETPTYGSVRFGSFRRVTPIHRGFDIGRGTYIDRYYIDNFLSKNFESIRGRVLELASNEYTMQFGGKNVTHSDILDVRAGYPGATIVGDLTNLNDVPSDTFDCFILTQTLNYIYDVHAAMRTAYRILKPGGCLLVSVPGIAQLAPKEMEYCGEFWRFTSLSLNLLIRESFCSEDVTVEVHGNILAALAFLHGLAAEELRAEELDFHDPYYELVIVAKAVKKVDRGE